MYRHSVTPARPTDRDRLTMQWPCPDCILVLTVYVGEEPRNWHRREDGRLHCGACHRRAERKKRHRSTGR